MGIKMAGYFVAALDRYTFGDYQAGWFRQVIRPWRYIVTLYSIQQTHHIGDLVTQ